MNPPLVADTGGLLRALARTPRGEASFPHYEAALTSASRVIVPGLVPAEVDYFLRKDRRPMRKLAAEAFDPGTRYEYEFPLPSDIVRAVELDARFNDLAMSLVDGTVAVGLLAAAGLAGPLWMQLPLFALVSVAALVLFRQRMLQAFYKPGREVDTMVGEAGILIADLADG